MAPSYPTVRKNDRLQELFIEGKNSAAPEEVWQAIAANSRLKELSIVGMRIDSD